jgi:hypothetical protein
MLCKLFVLVTLSSTHFFEKAEKPFLVFAISLCFSGLVLWGISEFSLFFMLMNCFLHLYTVALDTLGNA